MPSSDKLDCALEVLADPQSRAVLLALLDNERLSSRELFGLRSEAGELDQIELVHHILPKLADYGFVVWNRDAETVRRGPDWDSVGWLLRTLVEHKMV